MASGANSLITTFLYTFNIFFSLENQKGKQAEAEVGPSSILVEVKVGVEVWVEVGVEAEFEVGVEVEVKVGAKNYFFGVGWWVGGWRNGE